MKTVKRLTAIICVLFIIVAVTACGKKGEESGSSTQNSGSVQDLNKATVKFAYPYEVQLTPGLSQANDEFIARIADVEKKYNCKIEFVTKSQSDYYDALLTDCLAGTPTGDVINVGARYLLNYQKSGVLEPLNDYPAYKEFLGKQVSAKAAEWMTIDGKTYAMCADPLEQRMFVAFNKNIFTENNISDPYELVKSGGWTWDKFTEYAKLTTKYDDAGKITQFGFHGDLFATMASAIASNNGEIITQDSDGKNIFSMDNPNSVEALNQVSSWMHIDRVMNNEKVYWDGPMRVFEKGKAAMIMCPGIWVILERFNTTMTEQDYGILPFPKGPKADDYIALYDDWESFSIPTSTKIDKDTLIRLYIETKLPAEFNPEVDIEKQFRAQYESSLRDEGSMDVLLDLQLNNKFKFVQYAMFNKNGENLFLSLDPPFADSLAKGDKTAAQLIAEVKSPLQAYLDDNYNK